MSEYLQPDSITRSLIRLFLHVQPNPFPSIIKWSVVLFVPCQGKEGWVVDLSGNFRRFGRVEELRIEQPEKGKWCIMSRGRQLTNVVF